MQDYCTNPKPPRILVQREFSWELSIQVSFPRVANRLHATPRHKPALRSCRGVAVVTPLSGPEMVKGLSVFSCKLNEEGDLCLVSEDQTHRWRAVGAKVRLGNAD
jgi:hypothetical protein